MSLTRSLIDPHQPVSYCARCGSPWPCSVERARETAARHGREALEKALTANRDAEVTP